MRARLEGFEWVHDLDKCRRFESALQHRNFGNCPADAGLLRRLRSQPFGCFGHACPSRAACARPADFEEGPSGRAASGFGRSLGLKTRRGRRGWVTISDDPTENMQGFACYPERYPNRILATYSSLDSGPKTLIRLATPAGFEPATTSLEG